MSESEKKKDAPTRSRRVFFRATIFHMKQPKRKKRLNPNTLQLIRQIVGGVLVLIFVSLLLFSVHYVTRLPALTIQTVEISGGETIASNLVETLVETELEGDYMRLVPKRFSFLYPKQAIIDIVKKINRVKDLQVERTSRTVIEVTFSEYHPDALWCNGGIEDCVFIDANGYAFAVAPSLSGGSFLRIDKLGVEPVTSVQAFDTSSYLKVKELVTLLEDNAWFVSSVAIDVAGDAFLTLTEGGELKVTLEDPAEQIVENLFTVLSSKEFVDIGPGEFEYIDLRFGNKVFVNELGPEVATSTDSITE